MQPFVLHFRWPVRSISALFPGGGRSRAEITKASNESVVVWAAKAAAAAGEAISMTDRPTDGRTDGPCVTTTRVRSVECRVELVGPAGGARERGLFVQSSRAMYTELPPARRHTTPRTAPP